MVGNMQEFELGNVVPPLSFGLIRDKLIDRSKYTP
jgi:hypothetical protein